MVSDFKEIYTLSATRRMLTKVVANLPAEVAHLFEEAQAKQEMINGCCNTIASRDGQLQKFIKQNGSLVTNPKEESYSKTVIENFEKAQALQDERVQLVQKASALVCLAISHGLLSLYAL